MEFNREEKDLMSASWGGLFTVTGFCMLLFSGLFKWIDGEYSPLLIKIGIVALAISLLRFMYKLIR